MPPSKVNGPMPSTGRLRKSFTRFIVGDVNDSQVKVAESLLSSIGTHTRAKTRLSSAPRGRIAIDFRDGVSEMGEGDFVVVPRGVEHRPRSLSPEPVVLMFEPSTTLNTGDAVSALTVRELDRL